MHFQFTKISKNAEIIKKCIKILCKSFSFFFNWAKNVKSKTLQTIGNFDGHSTKNFEFCRKYKFQNANV